MVPRAVPAQFEMERKAIVKASGSLQPVPDWQVRTPLHRAVQILKRHRDIFFRRRLKPSPLVQPAIQTSPGRPTPASPTSPSATLQLRAADAAVHRNHSDGVGGRNPGCQENFADKWADYPLRRLKFEAVADCGASRPRGSAHPAAGRHAVTSVSVGVRCGHRHQGPRPRSGRTPQPCRSGRCPGRMQPPTWPAAGLASQSEEVFRWSSSQAVRKSLTVLQQALALRSRYKTARQPVVRGNR